jgi:hypothetical protein
MGIAGKGYPPMATLPISRQSRGSVRTRLPGIIGLFGVSVVAVVVALAWLAEWDIYAGRQDESRTVVEAASPIAQQQYDELE